MVSRRLPIVVAMLLPMGCYEGLRGGLPGDGGQPPGQGAADGDGDGGDDDDDSGDDDDDDASEPSCATAPGSPVRELTRLEYDNTVGDLLDTDLRPAEAFVHDAKDGPFDNNSTRVVTQELADQYLRAAEDLAAEADLQAIASCWPETEADEEDCAREFVRTFGRRAFRRPLRAAQEERYFGLYAASRADADLELDFDGALRMVVEAMLQSPLFVDHVEYGDPSRADDDGNIPLDDWELASRLSYTITGSMPDEALLEAAERGELSDPEELEAHARRLLEDGRAQEAIAHFFGQWLDLEHIDHAAKASTLFPQFDESLKESMRGESERFIEEVLWGEGDGTLQELLTANYTYVDGPLAVLYGLSEHAELPAGTYVRAELPAHRRGILGHASFLASHATSEQSSPVHRGVYVRDRLMCQPIAPPENFNPTFPDPLPGETPPELVERHLSDASCAGCHIYFDPIGLGFEQFDSLGRHRLAYDLTQAADNRGEILGSEDKELSGEFVGIGGLARRLADSPQVEECVAQQAAVYTFGLGASAECIDDEIAAAFVQGGGDLRELMLDVVRSEAFRLRAADDETDDDGEGCV